MRRLGAAIALLLVTSIPVGSARAVGSVMRMSPVAGTCGAAWSVAPSQGVTGKSELAGVAVISSSDAWAVGQAHGVPLAVHWDGTAWTSVATAPFITGAFDAVAAVATDDVWAVGRNGSGSGSTLIEHWDGSSWTTSPAPDAQELTSVSASGPDDVWAVGQATVLHWAGSFWGPVSYPKPAQWDAVTAISPTDAWAGGWRTVFGGQAAASMEWDGSAWTFHSAPGLESYNWPFALAATSSTNVWLAGWTGGYGSALSPDAPLVDRWSATGWSVINTPNHVVGSNDGFRGLSVLSGSNVWAAGITVTDSIYTTLVEHWNGSAWKVTPTPDPGSDGNQLSSIATDLSSRRQWAVGSSTSSGTSALLILQRCP